MADISKDTIYIDIDDEITTVIDKVTASDKKVVALVLPKRAAVFQSVVNMKLLKLKADSVNKNLVLITTESSLLPLAGMVGLHVAKTLASKPEIPAPPITNESVVEADEDDELSLEDKEDVDLKAMAAAPIGILAADKIIDSSSDAPDDVETIELDNKPEEKVQKKEEEPKKQKKEKKQKNLEVPNFEKFRKRLIFGAIILAGLVVLWWFMFHIFPKVSVYVQTDATNLNTSVNFTLSTTAQSLNTSTNVVPAKEVTSNKTYTATVNTTGQQNNGQQATGTVSLTDTECSTASPTNVVAGSAVVSSGKTYITQKMAVFPSLPSGKDSQGCFYYNAPTVAINAQQGGSSYNITSSGANFTVPGSSNVTGTGTATGGTDNITQVVTQQDITNAQNKINADANQPKQDLSGQLTGNNYTPIMATFTSTTPVFTPSASAGDASATVTVTETVSYSMYGVRYSDMQALVDKNIQSQLTSSQTIINDGLSSATYTTNASPTNLTVQTTAIVGPNLSVNELKTQIAGKKSADIEATIGQDSHVTGVTVKFSPFYVSTAPTNPNKITVVIAKPTNTTNAH